MNTYRITYKHGHTFHMEASSWEYSNYSDKYIFRQRFSSCQISRCRHMGDYVISIECVGVTVYT